jgi:uroporphyrinogen-III synthase
MPAAPPDAARARVLYPCASGARPVLGDGLRAKGWEVEAVVAYRTLAVGNRLPEAALDEAAGADVVTFTSPSTVRAYLDAAGDRRVPPVVACIGPVTAEAARRAGLRVTVVADEHGAAGLVRAVLAALPR